jgi:hypothetical protein
MGAVVAMEGQVGTERTERPAPTDHRVATRREETVATAALADVADVAATRGEGVMAEMSFSSRAKRGLIR